MKRAVLAEFFGTFWLVLGGCGAAVLAGSHIGFHGVALAFGLTVLTMAYAIGHISGCHLNPAVTCGLAVAGRFPKANVVPYIISQCLGAAAAAVVIYVIVVASHGPAAVGSFAANGYGTLSPDKYGLVSALVCEVVMTFMFLMVIIGATDRRAPAGFAPIAIGLCLTLVHLISIPVTNTSVNPARSLSQALFAGGPYIMQLWLFWLAPIGGAVLAAVVYRSLFDTDDATA
ncbi:MAG: aquaporin Z [Planctomycetes bacterium]|nr:aquaporin Z [Planctomycetota bacterium]